MDTDETQMDLIQYGPLPRISGGVTHEVIEELGEGAQRNFASSLYTDVWGRHVANPRKASIRSGCIITIADNSASRPIAKWR